MAPLCILMTFDCELYCTQSRLSLSSDFITVSVYFCVRGPFLFDFKSNMYSPSVISVIFYHPLPIQSVSLHLSPHVPTDFQHTPLHAAIHTFRILNKT